MVNNRGAEWHKWDLHLHTASSYDAYKGINSDEELCESLKDNEICAVAITDHFKIDATRIKHLREIAPDIVFFPGVELRTDKGSKNLHIIIIFSEDFDLDNLSNDFEAIMKRDKAKSSGSNDTIYWTFEDIVEFAKKRDGLLSIHAGKKTNGLDKEISNAIPVREAIKEDIAKNIDFFEVGQREDILDYQKHVFKCIKEKPIIMCSDCHKPKDYKSKETLWIKGDLTFLGLKQCLFQPSERVYIGITPPTLDRIQKNKQVNIDKISVQRIDNPINKDLNWFDFSIDLNPGLIAIIGNKGSGKSALSDIIGHLCKSNTMNNASFLNENRFRKKPKNFASDYTAKIVWADGHEEENSLGNDQEESLVENAQYLPQKYIEEVCNDIGDIFQSEINKVIFSYVDITERGKATNLDDLVRQKTKSLGREAFHIQNEIKKQNEVIINLERKKTKSYLKYIEDSLEKMDETLKRHIVSKPAEIKKPELKDSDIEYQTNLEKWNDHIEKLKKQIEEKRTQLIKINIEIDENEAIISEVKTLKTDFKEIESLVTNYIKKYNIKDTDYKMELITPDDFLEKHLDFLKMSKNKIQKELEDPEGLVESLKETEEEKKALIATTNEEERKYQKYLSDLLDWQNKEKEIIGNPELEGSLNYFKKEKEYLISSLEKDYKTTREKRNDEFCKLYKVKQKLIKIYEGIYLPIEDEISGLLEELEDSIKFQAEIQLSNTKFDEDVLNFINQKYAGTFKGAKESRVLMTQMIKETNFNELESVCGLIQKIVKVVDEDIEQSEKKISNKQGFYDYLFGLNYVDVSFNLKMGGRNLEELSPGERGIVLLIFYLALSKNNIPIIIDQPEDNLDNQSIFTKLVPCICKAKQKRQVIIVTHNPNIAVACDAEQIIYCQMDKNNCQIRYETGAIENPSIKSHVVDVLEGTMPAFDLRRQKYN